MTNRERFTERYSMSLQYDIEQNPEEYSYPISQIPIVVAKMLLAIDRGSFSFSSSPAMKRAAAYFNIRSQAGLREFIRNNG